MCSARTGAIAPASMTSRRFLPVANSITMYGVPSSTPKSITETQCGWPSRLIARASSSKRRRNSLSVANGACRNFTATARPKGTRSPRYTTPMPPAARRDRIL